MIRLHQLGGQCCAYANLIGMHNLICIPDLIDGVLIGKIVVCAIKLQDK
jgi:hypothetical protein